MDSVPVSLRLPEDLYHRLRRMARREAYLTDADISMADVIRQTLAEQYPTDGDEERRKEVLKETI